MPNDEEIDFDQAKPLKLTADVSPEKTIAFFSGEEENPLQLKDVDEAWMKEFSEMLTELDALSKLVEMRKADLKRIAKGEDQLIRGKCMALFKTVKGRASFDKDRFIKDKIGKPTEQDIKDYTSFGDPSVRFEGIRHLT